MSKRCTGRKLGPHSEETKEKIRAAHRGKKLSPEHKKKIGESIRGTIKSPETRARISASNKGKKHSEATRKMFSLMRKGKPGRKHPPDCPCCVARRGKPRPNAEAVRRANERRRLPEPIRIGRRKAISRVVTLRNRYGITVEEYDRLLVLQEGVCAICKRPCPSGKRLAVDHSHETGEVRGLLCRKCNRGIGLFHDSLDLLKSALTYLDRYLQIPVTRGFRATKGRDYNLKYKYGITVDTFNWLLEYQKQACAICLKEAHPGKHLYVDHDHSTDRVRGLLCNHCNLGLGHFDTDSLKRSIFYLEGKC